MSNKNRISTLIIISFATVLLISTIYHETWGDEMESWNMARNSTDLTNLYYNIRYGGNPGLWHLLMYIGSFFSRQMFTLQALNYIVAVLTTVILVKRSPFSTVNKFLISFGYYFVYEYGTIARHYALTALLLFTILSFYRTRKKNIFYISLLSLLLSASSPYGTILTLGIFICLLLEYLYSKFKEKRISFEKDQKRLASLTIIFLGIVLCYALAIPPEDGAANYQLNRTYKDVKLFKETTAFVWESYIPIPQFNTNHYWNTNVLTNLNHKFALSILLGALSVYVFYKNPKALGFYIITSGLFLSFSYIRFSGTMRHNGHLFLVFLGALWILYSEDKTKNLIVVKRVFISIILLIQLIVGLYFVNMGIKNEFYSAKRAAQFLQDNNYENWYFIADDDGEPFVVAGFLDREVYFPRTKREGTFLIFDQKRLESVSSVDKTIQKTMEKYNDDKKKIILILTYELNDQAYPVTFLKSYPPGTANEHTIYLYKWDPAAIT
ncbi:hypothetical protein ACFL13_02610 [Patescibacteria group bacterium]